MALEILPNREKISHIGKKSGHISSTISLTELLRRSFPISHPVSSKQGLRSVQSILSLFFDAESLPKNFPSYFAAKLPMMRWQKTADLPAVFSIFFLTQRLLHRTEITFFNEVKEFLGKSREIRLVKFSQFDFSLTSSDTFVAGEMTFLAETKRAVRVAETALLTFREACLKGFRSRRELLISDPALKMEQIKSDFVRFEHRFPYFFAENSLDFFSRFSALTTNAFKEQRPPHLLRRIFLSLDDVRRRLLKNLKGIPQEKKAISVRIFRANSGDRIGAAVALPLTPKYEHLSEEQLLSAAQSKIAAILSVDRSFCYFPEKKPAIHLFYIEWRREDDRVFSKQDLALLKKTLPTAIVGRIESLIPSTFAKCFEEDVMKNTVLLLKEATSCPHFPHFILLFDRVSKEKLFFTLLIAQEKNAKKRLKNQLNRSGKRLSCLLDREIPAGNCEACVFQIELMTTPDLICSDGRVHFALAREKIVSWMEKRIGKVRDYNGGLFEKKKDNLTLLKRAFSKVDLERIETFFYSIHPAHQQATLPEEFLCSFFRFFLQVLHEPTPYLFKEEGEALFASILTDSADFLSFFKKQSDYHSFASLVSASFEDKGTYYLGFFLPHVSAKVRELFKHKLRKSYEAWQKKTKVVCLRLSIPSKNLLDPRRGGDRNTTLILRSLFEGLTRFDNQGNISLALAKSYTLSRDQKTYTFHLKKSHWSNGDLVTAHDFAYAWKTLLSPSFASDFPELFYCIENAELAKTKKCSLDEVGIFVENNHTLIVTLKDPAPDFLERLAHTIFLPVPSLIAKKDAYWFEKKSGHFVSNGPFCLETPTTGHLLKLKKNPHYFGKKRVAIDEISIVQASTAEAIALFQEDKLDFVEIPNRMEGEFAVKETDSGSVSYPAPKISWFAINTTSSPLSNLHFRMALAASINRDKLKKLFSCEKKSALTVLPLTMTHHQKADFLIDYNVEKARIYLQAAALELGLKKEPFPPISLMVPKSRLKKSIAESIRKEWEKTLGLSCIVESYPWDIFYKRRIEKKFQLTLVEWGAPTSDPLSMLLAFTKKEDRINLCGFEDPEYKRLLHQALKETDPQIRKECAAKLEEILIRNVCVLPTFYERFWFFTKQNLKISAVTPSFNAMPDFSYFSFK